MTVKRFVSKKIGTFTESISTHPSFFGPSAFIDLIHTLQLDITGADVSFAAPLSFDAEIKEGDVSVSDMFNLYKYENMLYVMTLSGKEIKDFLEMSYYMWTNRMKSPDDHLLWFKEKRREGAEVSIRHSQPTSSKRPELLHWQEPSRETRPSTVVRTYLSKHR